MMTARRRGRSGGRGQSQEKLGKALFERDCEVTGSLWVSPQADVPTPLQPIRRLEDICQTLGSCGEESSWPAGKEKPRGFEGKQTSSPRKT